MPYRNNDEGYRMVGELDGESNGCNPQRAVNHVKIDGLNNKNERNMLVTEGFLYPNGCEPYQFIFF